jgi:hypothetical protein
VTGLARRASPFEAVVSPYHLTTREAAGMVALQLAERVVTLLLTPSEEGVVAARTAAARTPAYRRYVESWAWARALFDEGVIETTDAGEDPAGYVRTAGIEIAESAAFAPLREFLHPALFEDERSWLSQVAADVLKAGPDPAVSIPIAAGLDAFAAAHGLVVARSGASSVAQRAEARLGRVLFRVSVPVLVQGSAERVLLVRALLDAERAGLASAVTAAFEEGSGGVVRAAAGRYAEAFERERADLCAPPGRGEEDEVRVIVGEASLVGMVLPADAVLRSSLAAAGGRVAGSGPASGEVRTLVLKFLGGR